MPGKDGIVIHGGRERDGGGRGGEVREGGRERGREREKILNKE